ncbi:MAG: hemerythrin domain-containing protein [Planctomycetota bacterium]
MANPASPGMDSAGLLSSAGDGARACARPSTRSLRCTTALREEHAVMLRLLDCLERAAAAIRAGGPVCDGALVRGFRLINVFVCRGHYAKERHLLTMMKARGLWPLAGFLDEHRDSLDFAAAMVRSLPEAARGEQSARRMLAENATAYVGFMRAHIAREDEVVFAAADEILTQQDDAAAARAYDQVDHQTGGRCGSALAEDVERSLASVLGGAE